MTRFFAATCIVLSLLAGCKKTEPPPIKKAPSDISIQIGLIPERHLFDQLERYRPLAGYLSKKIGVRVKLKIMPRYGDIVDNFVSAGMDGAFFGSFTYALTHARLGIEVLARPENLAGRSSYFGLIFVRRDSGISTAKDMKGKRFAFVDKATTAGYLLPLVYFSENGVSNYKTYLKETYFAGTHEDVIYDVLNGKADIGAAKNTVFERITGGDERIKKALVVIGRSPDVPENAFAVRKDLDVTVKKKLKETLLNMHNDPEGWNILINFGARRFIETADKDYEPVLRYAGKAGIDLATYDYVNN
jgi:phosphonate transport system substrate-binding protein